MSEEPKAAFNEENLIDQVYLHRCLYDHHAEGYKDTARRNRAWDEVGQHMNVKGEQAKEAWEKLRRCFMNAIKRRKTKQMHPWRFEQRMSFLYNHIDPSKMYIRYDSEEQAYYSETEDSRFVDEIETTDSRVCDDDGLVEEATEMSASIKREEPPERDQNPPLIRFLQPSSVSNCSMSESDSNHGRRSKSIVDQLQSDPSDDDEEVELASKNNLRSNKRVVDIDELKGPVREVKKQRRKSDGSVENEQISATSSNDRDDIDLFFLSMAKTTKTLAPIDQARIKLQISQIVLGAQISLLERSSK